MRNGPTDPFDIVVAGTGPVGLLSALALSAGGHKLALVGPRANLDDGRTTALMAPALAVLDKLGLLAELSAKAAPLRVMRIVDATSRLIRSPVVTFHASEIGEPHFGLNVPNKILNGLLETKILATPSILWRKELVGSWAIEQDRVVASVGETRIAAKLSVAADGRSSPAREAAGIAVTLKRHPQSALALTFSHTRSHSFVSTEFHTESGPFTQVPLPGDRSSLVWVVKPEDAEVLAALSLAELSQLVEQRMQSMLGRVEVETAPQIYPLTVSLPEKFAQNRVALVGEAAHIFPPIGAQGLNLGIRDIEQLVAVAGQYREDPGSPQALAAYDRARRPDIFARTGAVSLLNGSLLSDMLPAQLLRSAGLNLLGSFAPLRAFFMREGLKPGSGMRSLFSMVREQVGR